MICSHLHTYLNEKNIPFYRLPFGVSIERKYYSYDFFKNLEVQFFDTTFVINYPN
jgi:hypothetical protein